MVMSLCRMGTTDVRASARHDIYLIDEAASDGNPNLEFLLKDLTESIVRWRAEGKSVFIHCVAAQSRTPTVGAAYLCQRFGLSPTDALAEIRELLPHVNPHAGFTDALQEVWS